MKRPAGIAVAGIGIFSAAFFLVTSFLLRRWLSGGSVKAVIIRENRRLAYLETGRFRSPTSACTDETPTPPVASSPPAQLSEMRPAPPDPVTFFRPIKSGEANLRKNLEVFLAAVEPGDQVIFSTSTPEELRLCEELASGHPGLDIRCLPAAGGIHRNPKINKLAQMEPLATHRRWIVLDSDAIPDHRFLQAFRAEWQSKNSDAISAPYAFPPAGALPSRLDALGTGLALWPGVALLRATGHLDFLTGACMGIKAQPLQKLGGWKILGDSLAEDHELGLLISRAGGKVDIASAVLALEAPDLTGKEWILHQHRAFVTFRLCNPAGSLGIPLTHGTGLSFFFALLNPRSLRRWILHLALLFLRAESAKSLPGPPNTFREIWLVSLLEPLFWIISWLPLPVCWGGRWIPLENLRKLGS